MRELVRGLVRGGVMGNVAAMTGSILLLAGSAEARRIAVALTARGWRVQALVSEAPRGPDPMPVPCRLVAFDDVAALALDMSGFDAVIDASHGFDGRMTAVGHAAADRAGRAFISLSRPGWPPEPGVTEVPDLAAAMALVPPGARVFSAMGWASLPACADFPGKQLLLRQTTSHGRKPPFDFVKPIFGDPPFTVSDELALFQLLGVDLLICRNLGGQPSRPKVDAALALGIPVILIGRPKAPAAALVVEDEQAVLDWVSAL